MITLCTLWKLLCVQSGCSKRSVIAPQSGKALEREKKQQLNIYLSVLYCQGIIPRNPEKEKKSKWDGEGGGRTKARTFITRLASVTKGTADCFVWWGIWEAISCTSEQSIIGVEGKPFICCFFPVSCLSLFHSMKHYLWTFALCHWMALGSSR